ncbi:MAG TPA: HAMP domain-containing sensor histidine kinase [Myxococcota bacterium]
MTAEVATKQQKIASALRASASKAADQTEGGFALVFASGSSSALDLRLRAAAGFKRPDDAQQAARALLPSVREATESEESHSIPPSPELGERAAGALIVYPLRYEDSLYGVLVVGAPAAIAPQRREMIDILAERMALRIAHAELQDERDELHEQLSSFTGAGNGGSEDVLRLSEQLFAQDIELMRNNEKLGKIERLKNDFIEKMSRELRTPLNSIIEAIISVMTGENENLSEGAKEILRSALDDGTAFLRTLQNILDLWRIKQGELPLEIQDVNFHELGQEAIFNLQEALGDKQITIQQRLTDPMPRIRTDLTKLNQILFLLLDNAAKFTNSGEIEISARVEDGRLYCGVRDTGIGICPDDQQFIFDEFYQVDDSSSQSYRGAGLGLTLVRDLVTLLDGELSITSDVGRGTNVAFDIPVQIL